MLCDPKGATLRAYGVRKLTGHARRMTFVIDGSGTIREVYLEVSPAGHAAEVLADLRALSSED